jgi:hypothetical protein
MVSHCNNLIATYEDEFYTVRAYSHGPSYATVETTSRRNGRTNKRIFRNGTNPADHSAKVFAKGRLKELAAIREEMRLCKDAEERRNG